MHWPDGRHYVGNWRNEQRSGMGFLKWSDGSYYEGRFAYGLRHGQGTMVSLRGIEYRSYVAVLNNQNFDPTNDAHCVLYEGKWFRDQKQGFGK